MRAQAHALSSLLYMSDGAIILINNVFIYIYIRWNKARHHYLLRQMTVSKWDQHAIERLMTALTSIMRACPNIGTEISYKDISDDHCWHYDEGAVIREGCSIRYSKGDKEEKRYMRIPIGTCKGKYVYEYAHRILCWCIKGVPPPHGVVRHICDNEQGRCLNPRHMVWATVRENNEDVAKLKMEKSKRRANRKHQ